MLIQGFSNFFMSKFCFSILDIYTFQMHYFCSLSSFPPSFFSDESVDLKDNALKYSATVWHSMPLVSI